VVAVVLILVRNPAAAEDLAVAAQLGVRLGLGLLGKATMVALALTAGTTPEVAVAGQVL
jgi:hypothetical protein